MNNLDKFLEYLQEVRLDAFMLNSRDEFLDEFTPDYLNRLKLLTGFTGSNGTAIISKDHKAFFTDGRYTEQAGNELDERFVIYDSSQISIKKWIAKNFNAKSKIGYDSKTFTASEVRKTNKFLQSYDIKLYRVANNPVDSLLGVSYPESQKIEMLGLEYTGLSAKEKIKNNSFIANLTGKQGFFTCDTTSICWLLNIRGRDTEYTPLLHSYFIYNKRISFLFCDLKKLTDEHKEYFSSLKIEVKDIKEVSSFSNLCKEHKIKQVYLDPNTVGYYFYSSLNKQQIEISKNSDPIIAQKAIKNDIEIEGVRKAHIIDGAAKTKFLYWLSENQDLSQLDEISIADKLLSFRKEHEEFCFPSFNTISAFAENGSIIHYNASNKTNKKLSHDSLLLLDSGGQYKYGTTDITRTIAIGEGIKAEHKRNYTLVLKGHISLAMAVFPYKTTGIQLDTLARQYLWQEFKDYNHGTGHGIGSFLNVHEGPQSIGKNYNGVGLKAGMVLSNEPGLYVPNQYGIRIENVVLVCAEAEGFLSFETISLVPLEEKLIDFSLLSDKEKSWLKNYHQKIYDKLSSTLPVEIQEWLLNKIKLYC